MTSQVRVRFAPSPTGYLHVGGARTALFNYLFARQKGGVFVLRIEDTDKNRSTEEHAQAILDGMAWLGFSPDEGPFYQSDRFEEHRAEAETLMWQGLAYPMFNNDFPSPRADTLPAEDEGARASRPPRPEIRSRADLIRRGSTTPNYTEGYEALLERMKTEPYAIIFKVPDTDFTMWCDSVHGMLTFDNRNIEDFVLVRSNGIPTYNMACTSDDIAHGITHVIRGDDHIANTPKQILLYHAFGAPIPEFGHLPMILGSDGQRLSKRHGATSVQQYQEEGVSAAALVNFLALLGWNPGDERELMSMVELVQSFSLDRVQKKAAIFDTKKLHWMNVEKFRSSERSTLVTPVVMGVVEAFRDRGWGKPELLGEPSAQTMDGLFDQYLPRSESVSEFVDKILPYFGAPVRINVNDKVFRDRIGVRSVLTLALDSLSRTKDWSSAAIEYTLQEVASFSGVGLGKIASPLRAALLGVNVGPPIDQTVYLMGKDRTIHRIKDALAILKTQE
jgi:glutamyl-tRNA synthetase